VGSGNSAVTGMDVTACPGSGISAALEARGVVCKEAGQQVVDALSGGTGFVYISGDELASCPRPQPAEGGPGGGRCCGVSGLAGWLTACGSRTKSKNGPHCNGDSSSNNDWRYASDRIDQLKTLPNGLLVVQRDKSADEGRIAKLQSELSIQHDPPIPIIPVHDKEAFISLLVNRSGGCKPSDPSRGRPFVTDKKLRRMLTALPGVDDPTAHKLLVRFKTVAGVLAAEADQIRSAAGLRNDQADKLYRLFQACRGHSKYSKTKTPALSHLR
jgi:hypothetical protein